MSMQSFYVNKALMASAQAHSDYQAEIGQVTHSGQGGSRPRDRAIAFGYGGGATVYVSENIAGGMNMSAAEAGRFAAYEYHAGGQLHGCRGWHSGIDPCAGRFSGELRSHAGSHHRPGVSGHRLNRLRHIGKEKIGFFTWFEAQPLLHAAGVRTPARSGRRGRGCSQRQTRRRCGCTGWAAPAPGPRLQ